jgi:hypothetical protein
VSRADCADCRDQTILATAQPSRPASAHGLFDRLLPLDCSSQVCTAQACSCMHIHTSTYMIRPGMQPQSAVASCVTHSCRCVNAVKQLCLLQAPIKSLHLSAPASKFNQFCHHCRSCPNMATLVLLLAALLSIARAGAVALQSNNLAYLSPVAELPELAKSGQSSGGSCNVCHMSQAETRRHGSSSALMRC